MLPRKVPSSPILTILLFAPLFLRLLWLLSLPRPYLVPDEIIYPQVGRAYVGGIMRGDLTAFRLNAEHPPLAKIILGTLLFLFGNHAPSDIETMRVLCALLSSLTCVIIWLHLKQHGNRLALTGWLLASIDPLSIRYSVALLDVTATMFLALSMYLTLQEKSKSPSRSVQVGVLGGLAALCKYSALPILLGTFLLEYVMTREPRKLKSVAVTTFSALIVILVGNPLLWPSAILGYSGLEAIFSASSVYSLGPGIVFIFDWLEPALRSNVHGQQVFYLSMFLSYISVFPFKLFAESIVAWVLLGCLVHKLRRRCQMSSDQLSPVPWLVSSILFFWLIGKSRMEPYYAVMMAPPMTLLATLMLPLSRKPTP